MFYNFILKKYGIVERHLLLNKKYMALEPAFCCLLGGWSWGSILISLRIAFYSVNIYSAPATWQQVASCWECGSK